jgi:chemotaxis protein histidine kinase CheA
MSDNNREPLLDMFLFETSQLLEQLEQSILASEQESYFTEEAINNFSESVIRRISDKDDESGILGIKF